MSSPGYTKNPCHGCGRVIDHKKDELCGECKTLMQHGRDFLEFKEKSLSNKENVLVRTPNVFSTYSHKTFYSQITESNSVLGKILNEIIFSISEPAPNIYYTNTYDRPIESNNSENVELILFSKNSGGSSLRIFPNRKVVELFNDLLIELEKALKESEDAGIKYGKNLLFQLNSGLIINGLK